MEELITLELNRNVGDDPVEQFNVRGNWTTRKFGNGDYRPVDVHTFDMLCMDDSEREEWREDFLEPFRESMKGGE